MSMTRLFQYVEVDTVLLVLMSSVQSIIHAYISLYNFQENYNTGYDYICASLFCFDALYLKQCVFSIPPQDSTLCGNGKVTPTSLLDFQNTPCYDMIRCH